MKCIRCNDTYWVCENHPDVPWDEGRHPCCGGAGAPCPDCNSEPGVYPRMMPGFTVICSVFSDGETVQ